MRGPCVGGPMNRDMIDSADIRVIVRPRVTALSHVRPGRQPFNPTRADLPKAAVYVWTTPRFVQVGDGADLGFWRIETLTPREALSLLLESYTGNTDE